MPEILDWKSLCDLQGQNWRQLSHREFLSRLKLKENLDAACLARVKKVYSEKQLTPEETDAAVGAARGYLVHLLKVFLADISLNAGIVSGLGSFDPVALLSLPLEQATYCFSAFISVLQFARMVGEFSRGRCPKRVHRFCGALPSSKFWSQGHPGGLHRHCCLSDGHARIEVA